MYRDRVMEKVLSGCNMPVQSIVRKAVDMFIYQQRKAQEILRRHTPIYRHRWESLSVTAHNTKHERHTILRFIPCI